MWGRAIAVWLVVMAVEFVHGTLRWLLLRPRVGDFRSGQIGLFTGSVLRDGLFLTFRRLAWKGSKSGVKPLHSRRS